MFNKVSSVTKVRVGILESKPAQIVVSADGEVPTSGWKNPELAAWAYIKPPEDGIQDFDFIAERPTGIVLPMITPISGSGTTWKLDWMKGVRVHSASNGIVVMLEASECKAIPAPVPAS